MERLEIYQAGDRVAVQRSVCFDFSGHTVMKLVTPLGVLTWNAGITHDVLRRRSGASWEVSWETDCNPTQTYSIVGPGPGGFVMALWGR